jgi:DnaK suppressor protein
MGQPAKTAEGTTQQPSKRYGSPMDPDRARELLQAERARIERALARVQPEDDGEPADEQDPANLAADLYQDELDETFADDLHDQLASVERAEARLAAGTYGLSIESGEPIADARLEARPTAELTADEERARTDR